ncbi:hypothetical protein Bca4012_027410 [Brassica carinata]
MVRKPGCIWVISVLSRLLGHLNRLISYFFAEIEEFVARFVSFAAPPFRWLCVVCPQHGGSYPQFSG